MAIDPTLPIPVYFQLKTLLIEAILEGDYGLDGRLPTEHQLCERHGISRTPVTRALSELATEGVVIRHRRRGTFVNPHWVHGHRGGPELRVIVPEGPWEGLIRRAAPADTRFSVATVELQELHQALAHAVAEGLGPDLAVLDSVWVPEFTAAGFLAPLEELDEGWVTGEYEHDFLAPLMATGRTQGRTFAVHAEADVAGLWFRRAALEELGLDPPATWAELLAAGRALAKAGGRDSHPVVLPGGSKAGEATTYVLLALLASNQAAVLEDGVVVLDGPSHHRSPSAPAPGSPGRARSSPPSPSASQIWQSRRCAHETPTRSAAQLSRVKVTQQRPGCGSSTARTVEGPPPSTWSVRAWSMAWLAPQTS